MEEKLSNATEHEPHSEDSESEKTIEMGKVIISQIHQSMISNILPSLNKIHKIIRANNSPLQKEIKKLYSRICINYPKLLSDLEKNEPVFAIELKEEMKTSQVEEPPSTPVKNIPFSSPLLKKISSNPISLLDSPIPNKSHNISTPPRKQNNHIFSTP